MQERTRIPQNTFYLFISEVVNKLLGIVFVGVVARHLGKAGYGELSFVFASVYLLTLFLDFGINTILVREIARNRERAKDFLYNSLFLKSYLALLVIVFLILFQKLSHLTPSVSSLLYIIGIAVIFTSLSEIFRSSYFIACEMAWMKGSLIVIHRLVELSLTLIFIFFLGGGLIKIGWALLLASLFNLIFSYFSTRRYIFSQRWKGDLSLQKWIIKSSLPLGAGIFFLGIYNRIDTVMLSFMKGDIPVGIYNAAYRLMEVLVFIPASLSGALLPVLSRYFKSSPKKFRTTFLFYLKLAWVISLPLAVIMGFFPSFFIHLIFGKAFQESTGALTILIWTFPLLSLNYLLRDYFISSNRQIMSLYFFSLGAFLNIILNLILIPHWSYRGAAAATLATEFWGSIFLLGAIKLGREKVPLRDTLEKPLVSTLGMTTAIHYGMRINEVFSFFAGIIAYVLLLLIQETFTSEEWKAIKERIKVWERS